MYICDIKKLLLGKNDVMKKTKSKKRIHFLKCFFSEYDFFFKTIYIDDIMVDSTLDDCQINLGVDCPIECSRSHYMVEKFKKNPIRPVEM